MEKFCKIINNETKEVMLGTGNNHELYKSLGMELKEVEKSSNGVWYIKGFTPVDTASEYIQKRASEYPLITEFLDAQVKIHSENEELILEGQAQLAEYVSQCMAVKDKYPK